MDTQPQSNRQTIVFVIILVALAVLSYMWWRQAHPVPTGGEDTAPTAVGTTTTYAISNGSTTINITAQGPGYTIKQVPVASLPKPPQIDRPLAFGASISADLRATLQTNANTLQVKLTKTPYDGALWINLGTIRKMAGDYEGARQAWEFVAKAYPTDAASFDNLGDLYTNYIKNYTKAESNYLAAIKVNPADTNPYKNLFGLYTDASYKGSTGAAENILKKGIVANPLAVDMQVILARYYKSLGRTADAKAEYQAAMTNAQSQRQDSLAAQIQQELQSM